MKKSEAAGLVAEIALRFPRWALTPETQRYWTAELEPYPYDVARRVILRECRAEGEEASYPPNLSRLQTRIEEESEKVARDQAYDRAAAARIEGPKAETWTEEQLAENRRRLRELMAGREMPLIVKSERDLAFAQTILVERRETLGCARCNPATWDPDGPRERWPCRSPAHGVICTTPTGQRELMYERCETYGNWAEQRRKAKESKPKKSWGKRTWNP